MADLRCPMCGKSNPAELEVCQYCQARLKPLIISPPGAEPPSGSRTAASAAADWLSDLRDGEAGGGQEAWAATSPEADGGETSDWLQDIMGETLSPSKPAPAGQEDADWMSRIDGAGGAPASAEPAGDDWWGGLGGEALRETAVPADDFASWLSPEPAQPAPAPSVPVINEPGGDDWWSSLTSETPQETAVPADDFASWLSPEPAQPAPAPSVPVINEPGGDDWWSSLTSETPQETAAPEDKLPDWLAGATVAAGVAAAASKPSEDALPDGLVAAGESVGDGGQFIAHDGGAQDEEPLTAQAGSDGQDWLADLGGWGSTGSATAGQLASAEAKTGGEDLSWLDGIDLGDVAGAAAAGAAVVAGTEALKGLPGVDDGELPDWLAQVHPAQTVEAQPAAQPGGEGAPAEIAQANLPGWLEAMRPVDVVGEAASMERVEGAGPLAGLKGVLQAEPDVTQVEKPPAYSSRLQISEVQQAHADLLRALVEAEGTPLPVPAKPVISSQYVLRLAIAAMLFVAILLPLLFGVPQFTPPGFLPESSQVNQAIGALPVGAPVLLAVDYNPAYAGEMNALTGLVLSHLISKNARLTLVSTLATGPTQAEELMALSRTEGQPQYASPDNYVNLGFIPGGATGLAGFAESPSQVLPGNNAWAARAMAGVQGLQDFKLVVVAADNAETARSWIEQIGPKLGNTPLVMVTTAQAEPLVRPYFDTYPPQIQGLLSGFGSGASYEVMLGRSQIRTNYWSPFSMGMLVAGALIAVGALTNGLSGQLARRKKNRTGKEDVS